MKKERTLSTQVADRQGSLSWNPLTAPFSPSGWKECVWGIPRCSDMVDQASNVLPDTASACLILLLFEIYVPSNYAPKIAIESFLVGPSK